MLLSAATARSLRLFAGLVLALVAALVGASPASADGLACSQQAGALRLCGARTDNYKDCYNLDDAVRERRSWLSWRLLWVNGAYYRQVSSTQQFGSRIRVVRVRGNSRMPARGSITVRTRSGSVDTLSLRNGPPAALWGPLLELGQAPVPYGQPVTLSVRFHYTTGEILARATVAYRHDAALAAAPASSPEYNGPGGRWWVGGRATATDVELGYRHICSS